MKNILILYQEARKEWNFKESINKTVIKNILKKVENCGICRFVRTGSLKRQTSGNFNHNRRGEIM